MSRVFFTDRDLGNRFPDTLIAADLSVERHRDHFVHDAPDQDWLREIGRRGWTAITHNHRIRYTPNELAAVVENSVGLLVVVGAAPFPILARSFVATLDNIEAFLDEHTPPFIAKVYRASPAALARDSMAPGRIALWYPHSG